MEIDGWSSLSGPDVYSEFCGVQCPYAIKDSSGMITGYDTWENDYYSRSEINSETLNKKHVMFLGDSFTFCHGVKREDEFGKRFEELLSSDYSCFNLAIPGGSNSLSLLRLQQWCNAHGNQIHSVYFNISSIARDMYWYTDTDWSWNSDIDSVMSNRFDYIPSNPSHMTEHYKMLISTFEKQSSKLNSMVKLETVLMSVINLSIVHGFKLYFWNVPDTLMTENEEKRISSTSVFNENIVWGGSIEHEKSDDLAEDDRHWSPSGIKRISKVLYNKTKGWYV